MLIRWSLDNESKEKEGKEEKNLTNEQILIFYTNVVNSRKFFSRETKINNFVNQKKKKINENHNNPSKKIFKTVLNFHIIDWS